jgi:lysozyme family protein
VFDGAVNSGPVQSIKWLQRALGVNADGQLGQVTLDAIETHPDVDALIADYCARRMLFLRALRTWRKYGGGWQARVSNVQRVSQSMAAGSVGPVPIYASGGNRKASLIDAKHAPPTVFADAGAGGGFTITSLSGIVDQMKSQIEPYAGAIPHLDKVVGGLAFTGVVLMAGGGAYAWYARRKAADLADRLDTKPMQLVAPAVVSGEPDAVAN